MISILTITRDLLKVIQFIDLKRMFTLTDDSIIAVKTEKGIEENISRGNW